MKRLGLGLVVGLATQSSVLAQGRSASGADATYSARGEAGVELHAEGTEVAGATFSWSASKGTGEWTVDASNDEQPALTLVSRMESRQTHDRWGRKTQRVATLSAGDKQRVCREFPNGCKEFPVYHVFAGELVYRDEYEGTKPVEVARALAPAGLRDGSGKPITYLPLVHPKPDRLRYKRKLPRVVTKHLETRTVQRLVNVAVPVTLTRSDYVGSTYSWGVNAYGQAALLRTDWTQHTQFQAYQNKLLLQDVRVQEWVEDKPDLGSVWVDAK